MQYLRTLVERFDHNKGHRIQQCIDVLDMIEYAISYPTCTTITDKELGQVEQRAGQILPGLKEADPLLAGRVEKWLENIKRCKAFAEYLHGHGHDHIGLLHYHEEILSIRKARDKLLKLKRGEKETVDDHGLFGFKYHHHTTSVFDHLSNS